LTSAPQPRKPGKDLLDQYLRQTTPEEMNRDRLAFIEAVRDRHKDQTAVLLGTGPSLRSIDLDPLRRFTVLGCNGIGRIFQPDYYVICDPFVYALHKDVFLACPGTRILSTFTSGECDLRLYYRRENLVGLARDEVFSADSTGYILLSIAYVMGVSRIILAGYDGYPSGRSSHHCYVETPVEHERARWEWESGESKTALMRSGFQAAATVAERSGCDIRLLTPSFLIGDLFKPISQSELMKV
jgi:hypothetical protein